MSSRQNSSPAEGLLSLMFQALLVAGLIAYKLYIQRKAANEAAKLSKEVEQ